MRVPFLVGGHAPLIKSFIHVPCAFHHPHELLLGANSALPFLIKESATGSVLSSHTQGDSWCGLSVRLTRDAPTLSSESQIQKMKDLGLLAYRTKCNCTVNHNITPDGCELLLLVKTMQSEDNLHAFIQKLNEKIVICTFESKDVMPIGY